MKNSWIARYEGNEIRIENSWIHGEKLYVNERLQDEKISWYESTLSGHIMTRDGVRKAIKANIGGFFGQICRLFIDDELVELEKVK